MPSIVARWRAWEGEGLEHLVLRQDGDGFTAESAVIGEADGERFAVQYTVVCDREWRTVLFEVNVVGSARSILLTGDGAGNWHDGAKLPELNGALDVDITCTPFTNTLPIRRLGVAAGEAEEIVVAYVDVPALTVTAERQRYTCLEPMRRYRFESLDGDFVREIEVDGDGLVVTYPGLFRRVL